MDAIIVGIDTALSDDPLLTARPPGPRDTPVARLAGERLAGAFGFLPVVNDQTGELAVPAVFLATTFQ
jgi:riboflavin biosynthesis pyrimidine reductase